MTRTLDETHDPALRAWLPSANGPAGAVYAPDGAAFEYCGDFPVQNLPFGIFRRRGGREAPRAGIAIGDRILDVAACREAGLFAGDAAGAGLADAAVTAKAADACAESGLNRLASLGRPAWSALRRHASSLLRDDDPRIRAESGWETRLLPLQEACELYLPAAVGDYTDFYASVHHATNVGRLFRPDQPLLPNYKHVPIGYHGRSSSLVPGGTPVRRPQGQTFQEPGPGGGPRAPVFGPSRSLDYEVEAGFLVGPGNSLGTPIPIAEAEDHLFGVCLLNDWSARDIQKWEYQPLGPFLAKSFATSLSPWVVTLEALEPFRSPAYARPAGDPAPLPYLDQGSASARSGFAITFELFLLTARMREAGLPPFRVSRGSSRDMYWTPGQLLAHHASNGCNLRPGDLLGSGTLSGAGAGSEGCLLERTRGGKEPLELPGGETRKFLADGDEVILRGYCEAEGFVRIGLGECRGMVLPALDQGTTR